LSTYIPRRSRTQDEGVDEKFYLKAGTSTKFPIPGLSIDIPLIGSAGVYAIMDLSGNADKLKFKLSLDACAKIITKKECGSKVSKRRERTTSMYVVAFFLPFFGSVFLCVEARGVCSTPHCPDEF
jgi:hypothetical protein